MRVYIPHFYSMKIKLLLLVSYDIRATTLLVCLFPSLFLFSLNILHILFSTIMTYEDVSASSTTHTIIQNTQDLNKSLVTIDATNITNWPLPTISRDASKSEFYYKDMIYMAFSMVFITVSPTITVEGKTSPNPVYTTWKWHNRLLFNALLSAVSLTIQPLLTCDTTTYEAWTTS